MKSVFTALLLSTLCMGTNALAALSFTDKGEASITITAAADGQPETTTIVETKYLETGYPSWNILKAIVTTTRWAGAEGMDSKSVLEMREVNGGRLDKVLWTATTPGSDVKIFNEEFVGVTDYGCCGASDTTRLFNATTGAKIEAAYGEIFEINVPNGISEKRYLSSAVDSKAPTVKGTKKYVGTLSYYTSKKIIARVRVYADVPQGWGADLTDLQVVDGSKKPLEGTHVNLWGSDGQKDPVKAYSGFQLQSKLYYNSQEETVSIAIEGDSISESASSSSNGVELVFVK